MATTLDRLFERTVEKYKHGDRHCYKCTHTGWRIHDSNAVIARNEAFDEFCKRYAAGEYSDISIMSGIV